MNSQDEKNILQSLHCTLSSQQISVNQTISFVLINPGTEYQKNINGWKKAKNYFCCLKLHLHNYSTVNLDVVNH